MTIPNIDELLAQLQLQKTEKNIQKVEAILGVLNGVENADTRYMMLKGLLDMAKRDQKLRTRKADSKPAYGSASPLVKPLKRKLVEEIAESLQKWDETATHRQRQGVKGSFSELLVFLKKFKPLREEIQQPELTYQVVAQLVYANMIDMMYVFGSTDTKVLDLKNELSRDIKMEWWRRAGLDSPDSIEVAEIFSTWGTKRHATKDQRHASLRQKLNDITGVKALAPSDELVAKGTLGLINLLVSGGFLSHDKGSSELQLDEGWELELGDVLEGDLDAMAEKMLFRTYMQLPLTEQPLEWRTTDLDFFNSTGGYHSQSLRFIRPLGLGRHRDYKSTASEKALDAINHTQSVRYAIDPDMTDLISQLINNEDRGETVIPGLHLRSAHTIQSIQNAEGASALNPWVKRRDAVLKEFEGTSKEPKDATDKQIRYITGGFTWKEVLHGLRDFYTSVHKSQLKFKRTTRIGSRFKELNEDRYSDGMWWSAGIDHRGRIYFKSDILSPQNSLIERHCLRFHEAKPLDDEGIRQVKIALGASMLGTKISIKEREEYGHKNWERCIEYGKDLFGHRWEYVNDADEWQYFAQLCAGLKRYQESGTWDVPLYFDATCSAVQWWSMLTNDVDAMRLSNLLPATEEDKPFDAYSEVKEVVKTLFTENKDELKALDELSFKEIEHVKQIIDMRPCLKESLMTGAYGSALPTRIKAIQKLLDEAGYEFNRKEVTAAGKLINTAMFKRFEIFSGGKFVRSLVRKHLKGLLDQYIKDNKIEAFDEFVFIVENDTDSELDEEQLKTRKNHIFEFNNEKTSEARKQELQELLFDEEDECTNAKNLKRLKPRESRKVARMWKCDGLCERSFYRWEKLAYERKKFYAQIAHRAKLDVSWTTPDEFRVHVTEKLEAQPEQVTMGTLPSVKVKFDIHGTVDINALARAASPSFIHSLDSTLLRMVILDLNCDVVPIHDCLGIHPSMVGALRKSLAANMYKIVGDDGRDVLKKFAKDITGNQGDWDDIDQNFPAPSLDLEETLKGAIYAWN